MENALGKDKSLTDVIMRNVAFVQNGKLDFSQSFRPNFKVLLGKVVNSDI